MGGIPISGEGVCGFTHRTAPRALHSESLERAHDGQRPGRPRLGTGSGWLSLPTRRTEEVKMGLERELFRVRSGGPERNPAGTA